MKKLSVIAGFACLIFSMNGCKKAELENLDVSDSSMEERALSNIANNSDASSYELFLEENVSLFDARIKSLDSKRFVKQLYFINFSEENGKRLPETFTIEESNTRFSDDGKGFDLVAGDGIYTSVAAFPHNKISFNENEITRSVLKKPVINSKFQHVKKLMETEQGYELRINPGVDDWQDGDDVAGLISITFNNFKCGTNMFHMWGCSWDSIDVGVGF